MSLAALALLSARVSALAQGSETQIIAGAEAIGLVTRATFTPQARTLTEAYLTQPMLHGGARRRWFQVIGTLNLEGLTLERGELDQGAWGEGYVDRRHPHAYLHELMLGAASAPQSATRPLAVSLFVGRGFVPFGSDDPMSRPFVSYPVDHHLAQILERLVVVGAGRSGPFALEAALFGGDEPLNPPTLPLARRFGDSWSLRATLYGDALASFANGAELSASFANVKSPEFREGQGMDQRKANVSLRFVGDGETVSRYALIELARTTDVDRGRSLYQFDAALAEVALCRGDLGVALRVERSDRPEEERLLDLFRSARPATDLSILGITEWTTLTAAATGPALNVAAVHVSPFFEAAHITADRTTAALFDPVRFYGSNQMWRASAGVRVGAGHDHGRMGRYGVASGLPMWTPPPGHAHSHGETRRCFS